MPQQRPFFPCKKGTHSSPGEKGTLATVTRKLPGLLHLVCRQQFTYPACSLAWGHWTGRPSLCHLIPWGQENLSLIKTSVAPCKHETPSPVSRTYKPAQACKRQQTCLALFCHGRFVSGSFSLKQTHSYVIVEPHWLNAHCVKPSNASKNAK